MLRKDHDEQELRRSALEALNSGRIPRERPSGLWGGSGTGTTCAICGHAIEVAEMELEVEFSSAEVNAQGVREFHLHLPCFAAWEIERKTVAE